MSQKRSNNKFFLGIAVALVVPLFCYFVVKELSKGKVQMPRYYGVESIDSISGPDHKKEDTVYHRVADLVLTNQLGHVVSLNKDLAGKIIVLDFFFSTCPSICPRLSGNMELLQNSFKQDRRKESRLDTLVHFVSITVDPVHDSFPVLRAYADRYGANHDHWWFLTGDKKTIYDFARHEVHLPVGPGDGGAEDFIHSEKMVLIDKDRYVRGYYNGLDEKEVRKCADDIVLLTLERKHK
jgi:protein SCO1/2